MIGILSIQGGVEEHEALLDELGLSHKRVRSLEDVEGLTGFIIPGGESTVMKRFMEAYGLDDWLIEQVRGPERVREAEGAGDVASFPVLGTCAGMILLSELCLIDIDVKRNAYGRQLSSFTTRLSLDYPLASELGFADLELGAHFIRAPKIVDIEEEAAQSGELLVLASHEGIPVLVKQGSVWAASFHPELAGDTTLHRAIFANPKN